MPGWLPNIEFHIDRIRICLEADLYAIPCLIASEYPLMVNSLMGVPIDGGGGGGR